jgi:phage terminase large subunit
LHLERYRDAARDAGCPADQFANFIRAGIVLQPKQLAASAAARLCDHPDGPTKIGYGGARGGGKSHWAIAQVIADDCQRFPGLKFLYLRKVGKAGREAIQDLRRDVLGQIPHDYKAQEGVISLPNGSRVVLGHFQTEKDIDNYLGLQYDGAIIEEATQLSSRKDQDIGTCVRSSKPGWRPRRYYTTNPGNIGHAWFKEMFLAPLRRGEQAGTRFIQATVRDNVHVNPEYRAELESLTGWQRRAWLDGDWDIAAGQFFTTFKRRVHSCRPLGEIPKAWRVWGSLDYGFVHFTVLYLFAEDGDGNVYVVAEHAERRWLPERHAAAFLALLTRHNVPINRLEAIVAGADVFQKDRDGGTVAGDYASLGLKLTAANTDRTQGAAEVLKRLGDVDAVPPIAPRLLISDDCPRLLDSLPMLEHDPHSPEKVRKVDCDENGLGGDDFYDSFRYGLLHAAGRRLLKVF